MFRGKTTDLIHNYTKLRSDKKSKQVSNQGAIWPTSDAIHKCFINFPLQPGMMFFVSFSKICNACVTLKRQTDDFILSKGFNILKQRIVMLESFCKSSVCRKIVAHVHNG